MQRGPGIHLLGQQYLMNSIFSSFTAAALASGGWQVLGKYGRRKECPLQRDLSLDPGTSGR
jgi:hypothetical protein